MKRYLIIIILLVLVGAAGFLYFLKDPVSFSRDTSLYKAVPVDSPFFFEFNSLKGIPSGEPVTGELTKAGIGSFFMEEARSLDSLLQTNRELSGGLRNAPFLLSFGFAGKTDLVPLVIAGAERKSRQDDLETLIRTKFPEGKFDYDSRKYGRHTITMISGALGNQPLFWSFTDGLVLMSTRSILVERSIRQLTSRGINENPYFSLVSKTVNASADFSFFLNHAYFSDFAGNWVNRKVRDYSDEFGEKIRVNLPGQVGGFNHFAEWSELDVHTNNDHLILSGISAADDSLHHFLSVFADQQPVRQSAEDYLPGNTSFYCSYAFSEKEAFFDRLNAFFSHSDFFYRREERMKRFSREIRSDIRRDFRELVRDEIIVGATTIPVNPDNKTVFFLMPVEKRSAAEEKINKMLVAWASRKGIPVDSLIADYVVDEKDRYPVYTFPFPSFPGIWLGKPFGLARAEYVTFYDDFMVFSNSQTGIRDYLRSMVMGSTLSRDTRFQKFRQKCSGRSNINVYLDINRAFGFAEEIFSDDVLRVLKEKEETIRKFTAVNWQIQREKDLYFNSVVVDFSPDAWGGAQTAWQSMVGQFPRFKPQLVMNHDDPDNPEIIVQDAQNNLHQLTGEGKVRWSISLPGPVLSGIHQVDYYKNGHLQYLFNTKEQLYLVDRNGNAVDHFPVKFRSPATNGVNVFDYNNNRDYRYFVACEDRSVVTYDSKAEQVTGWKFGKTAHRVTTPVQHFRIDGRDYIVFNDKSKVYIQDRRGFTRVETSAWFEHSGNPPVLNLDGRPKIVASDTRGNVHYIYFDGKHTEKKTGGFSGDHFFTADDLNGDQVPDFIFVDDAKLTVLDENGKKLFSEKFDHPVEFPPNIYAFGPETREIGIVEAGANKIYLFNAKGKLHEGFPLRGNTAFTIGKLSNSTTAYNLIVGNRDGMLLNYVLE